MRRVRGRLAMWASLLIFGLSLAMACCAGTAWGQTTNWPALIQAAKPAVVWILAETSEGIAAGSGTIISPDGYVLTAAHVVTGASSITIVVNESDEYRASVVRSDTAMDVAVLKIPASGLTWLGLGDSDQVAIEDEIRVLGYPLPGAGVGYIAVAGIIQGTRERGGVTLLQHNASTAGGHSGGPVVNSQGQVIGVHLAVLTDQPEYHVATSMNDVKTLTPYGSLPTGSSPIQPPPPVGLTQFLVTDVAVSPSPPFTSGTEAIVSAWVTNPGGVADTKYVWLVVSGQRVEDVSVALIPGQRQQVVFTYTFAYSDTYSVSICSPDDCEGDAAVIVKPAVAFDLHISVAPDTPVAGEETTISVQVVNRGLQMGTASVALTIDGVKVGESSLSVRPSSSEYVQFPYTFPTEGTHRIACTQGGAWGDQKDVIVSNPSCMLILGAHSGRVWSVAFSPNDRLLASWDDEMVRLWELPAGNPVRSIPYKAYGGRYNLLCFSPDGTLLVLSDHRCHGSRTDSCVQIWEVGTGQLFRTLPTDPAYWSNAFGGGYFVEDAAFSPDGRLLALFGGGAIRLHDVATGRLVRPFEGAEYLPAEPGSPDTKSPEYSGVNDVAFSRDGRRLFYAFLLMDHPELASRSSSTIVVEWDVATGRIVGNTRMPEGTNGCLYFSNDMTEFVSEVSGTAQFWDMGSRSVRQAFQVDLWGVSATALSPDGTVLASSGIHDPRIIKLWDVSTGQLLRTLEGHSDTVWSLAFSSDGGMLASCSSDGTARVWNVDGLRTP